MSLVAKPGFHEGPALISMGLGGSGRCEPGFPRPASDAGKGNKSKHAGQVGSVIPKANTSPGLARSLELGLVVVGSYDLEKVYGILAGDVFMPSVGCKGNKGLACVRGLQNAECFQGSRAGFYREFEVKTVWKEADALSSREMNRKQGFTRVYNGGLQPETLADRSL
eukprot:1148980-Pelagomonas_calceolata.AAC.1